jgi:hypothetical protein
VADRLANNVTAIRVSQLGSVDQPAGLGWKSPFRNWKWQLLAGG